MAEIDLTSIAAASISTPSSGVQAIYSELTSPAKRLSSKNDAGTVINYVGVNTTDALTNKTAILSAGTTAIAPLQLTSGTNLTTAAAGAIEYDGLVLYSSPLASARGLSPSTMYSIVPAGDFALQTAAGVQAAFPTTGDVWTLNASTAYFFEGMYYITKTTNSVSVAMAFAAGGSLSVTSILYNVWGTNAAADTTGTTGQFTFVDTISSTVVNAAATTASLLVFKGIIRINAGGTLTPQINFSGTAAGSPAMKVNSYITFTPLGTSTNNILGNVG